MSSAASSSSESQFLDRVSRGTPSAAAELDRRYRQRLCRLVEREMHRAFRSQEDPEDVVQSVFRTYFRRAALGEFRIQHTGELWALLATITRRKILKRVDYYRAEKRNRVPEESVAPEQLCSDEPGPADVAIAAELVERTLAGLDKTCVDVFQLRLEGHTEEEIAGRLECTRTTVRYQLARIRSRLERLSRRDSDP